MTTREALSILQPNERTQEALKIAYRKACKKYHPDLKNGNLEIMKLVNLAYEVLKDLNWTLYQKRQAGKEEPLTEKIKKFWDVLKFYDGINGEIIGSWLWVTGNTKKHKEKLKELGLKFSRHKIAWYWHNDYKYKKYSKPINFDRMRNLYGYTVLNEDEDKKNLLDNINI